MALKYCNTFIIKIKCSLTWAESSSMYRISRVSPDLVLKGISCSPLCMATILTCKVIFSSTNQQQPICNIYNYLNNINQCLKVFQLHTSRMDQFACHVIITDADFFSFFLLLDIIIFDFKKIYSDDQQIMINQETCFISDALISPIK